MACGSSENQFMQNVYFLLIDALWYSYAKSGGYLSGALKLSLGYYDKFIQLQGSIRVRKMLLEKLKALECSLHGVRRNDRKWLEQILHPEFREITRSGVIVDRTETIASLADELSPTIILSSDFRLLSIGECCAILHYKTFNSDGSRASLRSSCWVYSDRGQWELAFHQGTPVAGAV